MKVVKVEAWVLIHVQRAICTAYGKNQRNCNTMNQLEINKGRRIGKQVAAVRVSEADILRLYDQDTS